MTGHILANFEPKHDLFVDLTTLERCVAEVRKLAIAHPSANMYVGSSIDFSCDKSQNIVMRSVLEVPGRPNTYSL